MRRTYPKSSPYGQDPFPGQTVRTGFDLPSSVQPGVSVSSNSATVSGRRFPRSGDVVVSPSNGHRVDSRAPFVAPSGSGSTVRYDGHAQPPMARPFPVPAPDNPEYRKLS